MEYRASAFPQCSAQGECNPHRAAFLVSGEADRSYLVTVPERVVAFGRHTGSPLTVSQMTISSTNWPNALGGGQLDREGEDTFFVGGRLELPAGTPADLYQADLPVSVSYN